MKDRAGHDRRYGIDATKIGTQLGWRAKEILRWYFKTIKWYWRSIKMKS